MAAMVWKASFHPILKLPPPPLHLSPLLPRGLCTAVLSAFGPAHKCSPGSLLPGLHSSGSTVFLKVPSANTLPPFPFSVSLTLDDAWICPSYFRAAVMEQSLATVTESET